MINNKKELYLSEEQKQDFSDLLNDLAKYIKQAEQQEWINTEVDEKLAELSNKMKWINTIKEAKKLLENVEKELAALKDYKQFKELLTTLEEKVEVLRRKYTTLLKKELNNLQQLVVSESNISPDQIRKQAEKWRKKASNKIEKWIVAKLAQWNGWIAHIAQKALWNDKYS